MTDPSKPILAANLDQQRELLEQRQDVLRAEFVSVELDLAITFCQIALSTGDIEKMERNESHAEEAREAALHFLSTAQTQEPLKTQIEERLARLQGLLDEVHRKR